jgi:hypothetical protein
MKNKSIFYSLFFAVTVMVISGCSTSSDTDFRDLPNQSIGDNSGGSTGTGGSYARFTIVGSYLYAVHRNELMVYDLVRNASPRLVGRTSLAGFGWGGTIVETIFSYQNYLLFGTTTGVLIYDLNNPERPEYVSEVTHMTACDPVVARDGIAFVTLNSEMDCRGQINQLDVLNIQDITRPTLIRSLQMKAPRGLGVDKNTLFVCDGDHLVVFDVQNPTNPVVTQRIDVKKPYDVIPRNNNLILSPSDGIYQFDYSNPMNIRLNHKMEINK